MQRLLLPLILIAGMTAAATEYARHPYVQNVSENAATIMWETNKPMGGTLTVGEKKVAFKEATSQELRIEGLSPDTQYTYSINGNKHGTFKTFVSGRTSPVRFIIYGDNRSQPQVHASICASMLKRAPLFVVNTGDLVKNGHKRELWLKEFFGPARNLASSVPIFAALGNHELNTPLYFKFLALPNNERFYAIDAGCVHIAVLDSNLRDPAVITAQADWLEKDLAANKAPWTFAVFHHSPMSFRAAGLSQTVIDRYLGTMVRHGVDFIFSGHDHEYRRCVPMKEGKKVLTCFISAGGGAPLKGIWKSDYDAKARSCYHFCEVTADHEQIRIEAIDDAGKSFDSLTLKKAESEAYLAKAVPLAKPMGYMQGKFAVDFLRDPDEMRDSIRIEIAGKSEPGKEAKGRLIVKYNPFPKPLGLKASWVTEGTSWSVNPASVELQVKPRASANTNFTFTVKEQKAGAPKPVLKYAFSYEGRTGNGQMKLSGAIKQKSAACK